jgi:hypothetical protein
LRAITLAAPQVLAQHTHHSNTRSKIGHAIQHSVRKDATNASKVTHRAMGRNSVVHRNHGRRHYNRVLTPGGHLKPVRLGH